MQKRTLIPQCRDQRPATSTAKFLSMVLQYTNEYWVGELGSYTNFSSICEISISCKFPLPSTFLPCSPSTRMSLFKKSLKRLQLIFCASSYLTNPLSMYPLLTYPLIHVPLCNNPTSSRGVWNALDKQIGHPLQCDLMAQSLYLQITLWCLMRHCLRQIRVISNVQKKLLVSWSILHDVQKSWYSHKYCLTGSRNDTLRGWRACSAWDGLMIKSYLTLWVSCKTFNVTGKLYPSKISKSQWSRETAPMQKIDPRNMINHRWKEVWGHPRPRLHCHCSVKLTLLYVNFSKMFFF